jgi:hypothetical protein
VGTELTESFGFSFLGFSPDSFGLVFKFWLIVPSPSRKIVFEHGSRLGTNIGGSCTILLVDVLPSCFDILHLVSSSWIPFVVVTPQKKTQQSSGELPHYITATE